MLFNAAQLAALAPLREASYLVPDSSLHPADVLLPKWIQGGSAALDVHVFSPVLQQTLVADAASNPGHAIPVRVRWKLISNLTACHSVGAEFACIGAETLGGLAADAVITICAIGRVIGLWSNVTDPSLST